MVRCVLALVLLAGCGRVGFEPSVAAELDAIDADAAQGDATTVTGPCAPTLTPETVALYTFEAGLGDDATGNHPATPRGTPGTVVGRCGGTAIDLGATGYLLIADSPAFELATGSLELYVRSPQPGRATLQALVARDADQFGQEGHFLILINTLGEIVVRLQRGGASYYRCSAAIPADTWVHVGVSFGGGAAQGLRVWVDGVEGAVPSTMLDTTPITCTGAVPDGGITGNSNAFVLGANNGRALEGSADPMVEQYLIDGAIDQVRIRSTWRDFGAR